MEFGERYMALALLVILVDYLVCFALADEIAAALENAPQVIRVEDALSVDVKTVKRLERIETRL